MDCRPIFLLYLSNTVKLCGVGRNVLELTWWLGWWQIGNIYSILCLVDDGKGLGYQIVLPVCVGSARSAKCTAVLTQAAPPTPIKAAIFTNKMDKGSQHLGTLLPRVSTWNYRSSWLRNMLLGSLSLLGLNPETPHQQQHCAASFPEGLKQLRNVVNISFSNEIGDGQ